MSVAVSCNLSDGVILGVDSSVTLTTAGGVVKTYENAEKLFQLGDRPIGVAAFGIGALGERSIGSYIREFEMRDPDGAVSGETSVREVVETLQVFLLKQYKQKVVPTLEEAFQKPFGDIPIQKVPKLSLVVGGFSSDEYLSEVWSVSIPSGTTSTSPNLQRDKGQFGANWFALFEPIRRYFKGCDPALLQDVESFFEKLRGKPLTAKQRKTLFQLVARHEYKVPFAAMPMEEGVQHVRFLIDLVINHFRFAFGAPVVGGRVRIGKVTYRGEKFKIIQEN